MMAVSHYLMSCLSRQKMRKNTKLKIIHLWWIGNLLTLRAKNAAVELGGSYGFETQTMPNAFRNVKKTHFLPYIIASPVSCRKRTLLCLKSHIVRIVSVKSKMNVSKFTLSCLWLSSASLSVVSSSMPPSSALIRQHWLKMNVKIGNIELCPPNAYNVHGFGAAAASMVQDADGGLPHSLLQLRQVESEAVMRGIREQTTAQALKETRTPILHSITSTFHGYHTKQGWTSWIKCFKKKQFNKWAVKEVLSL